MGAPKVWVPHSYQGQALDFLRPLERANLFARMGSGKTAIILTALLGASVWGDVFPVLVIGPLRVARSVWPSEVHEWAHLKGLKVATVLGDVQQREAALQQKADIYTINYDQLVWLITKLEGCWPFKTVIADESTRLKGFRLRQGTARAGALAKIAHHKTRRWINLSGLPAPNGLIDLWGQQWFIDGGQALGRSFTAFEQRWFYRPPRGDAASRKVLPHIYAQRQIEDAIRPTTLAIDPRVELAVDEPIVTDLMVDLPPAAMAKYRQMEKLFFTELEHGAVTAPTAAVKSNKLLQMANGAAYHEDSSWSWVHDEKIEALKSVVEEAAGMPVLVAYTFRSDLERMRTAFPKLRVLEPSDKTAERDWNGGAIPLLAAHPKSAGHGLNLQHGGNILVYFGQDWNLEDFDQILERIGPTRQRQSGYKRAVFVYHILARGTLDAAVKARRATKVAVVDALMDAMKGR